MDAFFVSVEEHDNPDLKGHPVVVGYDGPRGVVATANYEARKFGVHSAMSVATAHRLCPDLIVVEGHYSRYKEVSARIHAIFRDYTDLIEPLSLDEAYLDVTANKRAIPLAMDIAKEIKQRIYDTTGLTASAGVSYCKFLAKVASDYRKPNGLCVVHPDKAIDFIDNLKIERFWGVGEKTAEKMHSLGVTNGKQLRDIPLPVLTHTFGKMGRVFYDFARGIDPRPVVTEWVRKSVGCEHTFAEDITTYEDMLMALTPLASELVRRLEKNNFKGRSLVLKVKYSDFRQTTHSYTGSAPIESMDEILSRATTLLDQVDTSSRAVRLMGLTLTSPVVPQTPRSDPQLTFDW
ncbi:MAG: DNA polymerase IV [Paludibacteraceae bacterium]|nr:DNA polymerase IV [Paludibacteraceae bacterium]